MSTHRDLAVQVLTAFSNKDIPTLQAMFAPDITFHVPGHNPMAGIKRGPAEVMAFFGQLAERAGNTEYIEVKDVLGSDQHAVALCVVHGSREGRTLHNPVAYVMRFNDGRLSTLHMHNYDQHHVDAFWS